MSNWHMGLTDQTNSESKLREAFWVLPICYKATCRHPILSRNLACPQHNRTNENDETLTLA